VNLALLLHIYQPPIQESKAVKEIAQSCYIPLIKSIKNNQHIKLTLNMPLSLVYQLHVNGFEKLISDIKDLYESDRLELTSCAAYHPILTKIPPTLAEKEIILNEYGLGYYFGKNKGFEGEEAILVKNINGFFPPEMAVNQDLLKLLDGMGYQWVVLDETAIPGYTRASDYYPVYNFPDLNIKAVCRHKGMSDFLSFKRDTNVEDLAKVILELSQNGQSLVLGLDGEFFGHHFDEGMFLFEAFVRKILSLGINLTTVSELVEKSEEKAISAISESTWGTSAERMIEGDIYTLWDVPGSKIHTLLWEILAKVAQEADFGAHKDPAKNLYDYVTFPVWDLEELNRLPDVSLKNKIYQEVLLLQCLSSDQFWWSSNVSVNGKVMFSPLFVQRSLELYRLYATVTQNQDLLNFINIKAQEIAALL